MALRPPSQYSGASTLDPLSLEIAGEKAAALGRAGERVETALKKLGSAERDSPQRAALLKAAAAAVHAYFIQRELCGLHRHHDVIREYGIPPEVLARLGTS